MTKVWVIFKENFHGEEEFVEICASEEVAKKRIKQIVKSYYLSAPRHYYEEQEVLQ